MAIQEFIIGPQNYFEAGYFDGDYTLPNVSKSFLECDIDKIRSGRVVTGEYFLDNYIDGTYYHNNSMSFNMVADAMIVQVASVSLQGYYVEGYYEPGYYQSRGSFFVLTAELTPTAQTIEAVGNWTSAFTQTAQVGKVQFASASISAAFTQTTAFDKLRGIILSAFSQAAIAIEVSRIRDNNAEVSSVFSVATDGRRFRDLASAEDSLFTFSVVNQRSRAFTIETQTAFSLTGVNSRTRQTPVSLTSTATLACTISHIEGADIIVNGFAALSAIPDNRTRDMSVSMSSSSSLTVTNRRIRFNSSSMAFFGFFTADNRRIRFGIASLNAVSSLTAVGTKYKTPGNVLLSSASSVSATVRSNPSGIDYGAYDIFPTDFSASFQWQFPRNVADSYNDLIDYYTRQPALFSVASEYGLQVNYGNGQGDDAIFVNTTYLARVGTDSYQVRYRQQTYFVTASVTNALSTNTWRSFSVNVTAINQSTGAYTITASHPVAYTSTTTQEGVGGTYNIKIIGNPNFVFFPVDPNNLLNGSSGSGLGQVTSYQNSSYSRLGTVYRYDNFPTIASADLINNPATLTATGLNVQFGTASMAAAFTRTITPNRIRPGSSSVTTRFIQLTVPTRTASNITSNFVAAFTQTASAQRARLASAVLSSAVTVSTANTRVRFGSSVMAATAAMSVEARTIGSLRTDLTATFTQSTVNGRIRYATPQLDAIATNLTAAFRNATGTVLLESVTAMSITAQKITVQPITLSSAFTQNTDIKRFRDTSSSMSAEVSLFADIERIQAAGSNMSASFALTANTDNSKTTRFNSALQTTASAVVIVQRNRSTAVTATVLTTLIANNQVLRLASATLASEFQRTFVITRVVRITAVLQCQGFQIAVSDVFNIDAYNQLIITQETRGLLILPESRLITIEQETRLNII